MTSNVAQTTLVETLTVTQPDVTANLKKLALHERHSGDLVCAKCTLIKNAVEPGGAAALTEVLTKAVLGTLPWHKDGRAMAHTAFAGHPSYPDAAAIDAGLLVAAAEKSITCVEIQAAGGGCPANLCVIPPIGGCTEYPNSHIIWDALKPSEIPIPTMAISVLDAEFSVGGLICINGRFYCYREGAYRPLPDNELMSIILRHYGLHATQARAECLMEYLKLQQNMPESVMKPNLDLICFANATLDTRTWELLPHSPEHMLFNSFTVAYDMNSPCPRFLTFLDEIFRDDPDKLEKIAIVRQWMGQMLVPDTRLHKMLIAIGHGANGKSVLCQVMESMVGAENASHAMLHRLGSAIVRAELEGKLVNFSPDLPMGDLKGEGYIKAIIGGERMETERKYVDSYSFTPYARLVVATNHMPECKDTSDGFIRRLIILQFNRQFPQAERDPSLLEKLLAEMPGITSWAVGGLRDLRERGLFTIPPSSEAAVEAYRKELDPVKSFSEECLVASNGSDGYTATHLFEMYRAWCKERGSPPGTQNAFSRGLTRSGFQSRRSGRTLWLVRPTPAAAAYFPGGALRPPAAVNDEDGQGQAAA